MVGKVMSIVTKRAGVVISRMFSSRTLLLSNTVSCCALMGLGDVVMQHIERIGLDPQTTHNWKRTGQRQSRPRYKKI